MPPAGTDLEVRRGGRRLRRRIVALVAALLVLGGGVAVAAAPDQSVACVLSGQTLTCPLPTPTPSTVTTTATATSTSTVVRTTTVTATPAPSSSTPTTTAPTTTAAPAPTPGWTEVFYDDFSATIPEGSWPAQTGGKWVGYDGFKDTRGIGTYENDQISQSGGHLVMHIETVGGVPRVTAPSPVLTTPYQGMAYGRYTVRFMADATFSRTNTAWLLWPDSNNWNQGEIDYPEGSLNPNSCAADCLGGFNHCPGAPTTLCGYFQSSTKYTSWHTAVTEWKPNSLRFILDDVVVMSTTVGVPSASMHYVGQTEHTNVPAATMSGRIYWDSFKVEKFTP